MRLRSGLMAFCAFASLTAPALAHDQHGAVVMPLPVAMPMAWGTPYGGWQQPYEVSATERAEMPGSPPQAYDRDNWLRECRRRLGDNGAGGAVIGGVVGGVAGNVIAGHGDKLVGTVAGAAVGALAGRAIDKGEDAPRVRDRCEAMLDGGPDGSGGYAPYGTAPAGYAGYGYAGPVMMVPVMMVPAPPSMGQRKCSETVTTTTEYIDLPRRSRHIPRRAVADKRARMDAR